MKLQTLRPRIGSLSGRLTSLQAQGVDRLRGRAAVTRRERFLHEHPLCVECERQGRVTAATVPDHIVALVNGGADDESNLQALCAECHRKKTARDLGHKARPTIGLDGWPE